MKKSLLFLFICFTFIGEGFSQVTLTLAGYPISSYTSGWVIGGAASTVDSEIQLTPNAGSEAGYAYYNTSLNVTACGQFTVDFDYNITHTTGCLGDGIGFYFINPMTSFTGGGGLGMPNPLTGFVFTMDDYDNDGDGLNPEDELFGYTSATTYAEGDASHHLAPILSHQTYMADGTWHHIHISYNGGTIRVYVNSSATPTMTGTFPIATAGYFGFSAGTGACIAAQYVKNIYIVSNTISSILGVTTVCEGSTTALADSTTGGTWSSSNSGVASVVSGTGVVTGVTTGTATISYSYGTSCVATTTVNVVTPPSAITGTTNVCMGLTTTLYDGTGGGTWSSGSTSTATVNPTSGVVTGIAVGAAVITYSTGGACYVLATVNVTPQPTAITGTTSVCTGFTTTLSDPVSGGTWTSGSTAHATVGATSGVVTGIAAGVVIITCSIGSCFATTPVTVNASPSVITGPHYMCTGFTTTLSDSTASGSWSSATASIASVASSSGVVTGIDVFGGITNITYTLPGGCFATARVTVNPLPATIAGLPSVCVGSTDALFSGGGSGTWTSSDITIATVDASGVVTGVGPGLVTITFTLATGCSQSFSITVVPQPGPITGNLNVCVGDTTTLSDTTVGAWSSVDPAIGTVDPGTGIVTGIISDTVTIIYTSFATSCFIGTVVTVNSLPSPISGTTTMCQGSSSPLFDPGGGTWSVTPASIAVVGPTSGIATGVSAGAATVTYTLPLGCAITAGVVVSPLPGAISGPAHLCVGLSATCTDPSAGGTWTSSIPSVASIGGTSGSVTAINPGVTTLTYTAASTGCTATLTLTVNSSPGLISGPASAHICSGSSATFSDAIGGGTWACTPSTVATIGSSGTLTGTGSGTATITYSLGLGCSVTTTLTVNPLPGVIGGSPIVCIGSATTLSDGGGGTWSSTSPNVSVSAGAGLVTGLSTGTAIITYTLSSGCSRTVTATVNPSPFAISGASVVCVGSTIPLTDGAAGGTWSSAPASIATIVSATGVVTGVGTGTAMVSYTLGTGCAKTMMVTVDPLPGLFTVTGGGGICGGGAGLHVGLGGSSTGFSYQLYYGGTTVGGPMTGTGGSLDFGTQTLAGAYTVIATNLATGCTRNMTGSAMITVNPPPAAIIGPTALCVGASVTETDASVGGTWLSSLPSGASIDITTGVLTGHITGTCATITYTLATGCSVTTTVCVSPSPGAILGAATVCAGAPDTLTDGVPGGVWTSGSTGTATAGSLSGIIEGVATGTTTVTYSLGTGCTVTKALTVTPSPSPVMGATHICAGAATLLSDGSAGGTWSAGPAGVATISGSGLVSGISGGTAIVSYTSATGCAAVSAVTVQALPPAIGGPSAVCIGATITQTDATTGGLWSNTGSSIAISSGGVVTGLSSGSSVITYTMAPAGCIATKTITVNTVAAIGGATGLCTGATTILTDAGAGGTWSAGSGSIVSVGSLSGAVTGIGTGAAVITYSLGAGCTTTITVMVSAGPSALGGIPYACVGTTMSLTETVGGGAWSSSATGIATVDGTGVVTGVAPGTSTISYSLGTGCTVSMSVTVNTTPSAITGIAEACAGLATVLGETATGGAWSSSAGAVATVSPSGIVTGVSGGIATISYTAGACAATMVVTIDASPSVITGAGTLCAGLPVTMSDSVSGGVWSAPGGMATVDTSAGIITGTEAGTTEITYTLADGCMVTKAVTFNPSPDAITGSTNICIGYTTSLTDLTPGGTWTISGTPGVAAIGVTGIVTGMGTGTATVSYSSTGSLSGCPAVAVITVNSPPGAIAGTGNMCLGYTDTLSDLPGGGTWSSSNVLVAAIGSSTGAATGIAPGTATIGYSLGAGCTVHMTVTVHPAPPAITGPTNVCAGHTVTLSDVATGGTWAIPSGSLSIASVSPAGVVSGITGGTAVISYFAPIGSGISCPATYAVAVTQVPPIMGISNICAYGATLHVSDSATGGAWTSALVSVTPAGMVTGYAAGAATIYYTLTDGCYTSATLTVNPLPDPITGSQKVCIASTTTLGELTTGGVWSSSDTTIATATAAMPSVVSAMAPGTATIAYTLPTGCAEAVTVTVSPIPSAISGADNVCVGATAALTDLVSGGTWSAAGSTGIVSVSSASGAVTGLSAGTANIIYTVAPLCNVSMTVTVNPLPAVYSVSGGGNYCAGGAGVAVGLTGSQTGAGYQLYIGTAPAGSVVTGTGAMLSFGAETAAGVYRVAATTTAGCSSPMADSAVITITPTVTPSVSVSVTPGDTICAGTSATFTATSTNGGTTPTFQWQVNTTTATTGTSYTYTPANGDMVTVLLTSDATCAMPDTISKTIAMAVDPELIPVVTIHANPGTTILTGQNDTLSVTWTGAGTSPTYQWYVNGVAVPGATSATYTGNNLSAGDSVSCAVLPQGPCGQAGTNGVKITTYDNEEVAPPLPIAIGISGGRVTVVPNPNKGIFTVTGMVGIPIAIGNQEVSIEVTDLLGQVVYHNSVTARNGKLDTQVQLSNTIANGMYILNLRSENVSEVFHIVVER